MTTKILTFLDQTIWLSLLALTIVTPLLFSTQNTELFEIPKMLFVYLAAVVVFFLTLLKFVINKKILVPENWPLTTLLIFLIVQIFSTFSSIDKFTSVFGYPSRLNGGLLSQIAYLLIFTAALINLNQKKAKKLLLAAVITALAVSVWGIPAHFGKDPSCLVLTGNLNSTCWQKEFDPTLRIFSTLGQPNWLASYLVLSLPFSLALLLAAKNKNVKLFFFIASTAIFFAFILTNSRAGLAGVAVALTAFVILLGPKLLKKHFQILAVVALTLAVLFLTFGTTLLARIEEVFIKKQSALFDPQSSPTTSYPLRPRSEASQLPASPAGGTATSSVGTESGQIRLIVWQGAFKIFTNYPILGSGPETFAYAYYKVRPLVHNATTEWNFFYNKAHNEFLNYLANLGILGFAAFLAFVGVTLWQIRQISQNKRDISLSLLAKAAIAAIAGYLTTIFFGFSVVTTQLLFFLTASLILVLGKKENLVKVNLNFNRAVLTTALLLITVAWVAATIYIGRIYFADLLVARAKANYQLAVTIYPGANPFYLADLAYAQALAVLANSDPKTVETLIIQVEQSAEIASQLAPNNLIIQRRLANTYFALSTVDSGFGQRAQDFGQKLTELAPSDPQSYLTLAKIQAALLQNYQAKKTLEIALNLKPDYQEARDLLEQLEADKLQ